MARVFLYEYTQNIFFTKMISPYQLMLMKFEVVMNSIKNMTQMKAADFDKLKNETELFKFFMKHYRNEQLSEENLYNILIGSIKLAPVQELIIEVERSDSDRGAVSSETEATNAYHDPEPNQVVEANMKDVLSNLSVFPDIFPNEQTGYISGDNDIITDESLALNFTPEIAELILSVFKYYDKDPLAKENFGIFYLQYKKERTNLYNSIKNCYKLFRTYNFTSITFQIIITVTLFMICLEIQPRILSMFMAIFSFAFFPSLVAIVENFIMLIVNHPFDCGDRIYYQNENYIVSNINLFCCVFEKWNGEFVIVDNKAIGKRVIQNVKRSNRMNWSLSVYIHMNTCTKDMTKVIDLFKSFCERYVGKCTVYLDEISGVYLKYTFMIEHTANFQNGYFMWKVHNKYALYIKELLNVHQIKYEMPKMNVNMCK